MNLTKSIFHVSKMDCSAEEQIIKMKLSDETSIRQMIFDLQNRKLTVIHEGPIDAIHEKIKELNFGDSLLENVATPDVSPHAPANEARLLWYVLWINFSCFLLEIVTGFIGRSMGLVADSLDMLADAFVYALSLYAVGKAVAKKKQVANLSGYLQLSLAVLGFIEVVRRFLGFESVPDFRLMVIISSIALVGNALSLWILQRSKSKEAHIKASMIFTANDVIINIGVIIAGILVLLTESNKPDLVVGSIVFVIVMQGAIRILKLAK